jgi:YfiR/HmsC-like
MNKITKYIFRLLALAFVICHLPTQAQDQKDNYKMYADLLYHFTKNIEWPTDKQQGVFVIGVYGEEALLEATQNMMKNRVVNGQKIVVKQMNSKEDLSQCHIVFVERTFSHKFSQVQSQMKSGNILLITEGNNLAKKGASINFVVKDEKLKFEMNKAVIDGAGLKVSSDLVRLSILVG